MFEGGCLTFILYLFWVFPMFWGFPIPNWIVAVEGNGERGCDIIWPSLNSYGILLVISVSFFLAPLLIRLLHGNMIRFFSLFFSLSVPSLRRHNGRTAGGRAAAGGLLLPPASWAGRLANGGGSSKLLLLPFVLFGFG